MEIRITVIIIPAADIDFGYKLWWPEIIAFEYIFIMLANIINSYFTEKIRLKSK